MDRLKNNYLWLVAALAVVGALLAYISSESGYVTQQLTILDANGKAETIVSIKQSAAALWLSIASTFVLSVAISVFVSVFVIKRIDDALAEERTKKLDQIQEAISVNVFDSLFKTLLPKEIFDVFKSDVISSKIVRRNANWIYDFKKGDAPGEIELVQTIKHEIHNIGHESINDAIKAKFDGVGSRGGIRRVICLSEGKVLASFEAPSIGGDVLRHPADKTDMSGVDIHNADDGVTHLLISIAISPGKKVDVTIVYSTIYENNFVHDGFFTQTPVIGASLTATYPEDFEFELFQAMSSELQLTLREPNRSMYEVGGGILPHQGYIYTLRKRATVNRPQEAAGAA